MASKREQEAISIKQLIADQNALQREQLRILRDQAGIDSERLSEQQDISNVIKDQIKQLKFQKAEKSLILKTTNAINRLAEKGYSIGQNELGTLKGIGQLQKDRLGLEANIRNLINQRAKIVKDSKLLSEEDQKLHMSIADSLQDQVNEAIKLNKELGDVEKSSIEINRNLGVKTFSFLSDATKKIPGLGALSEPFTTAADGAREMVSGIENAAKSGGKGLTKERIKQLGLEKQLGNLSGAAAAQKLKGMSSLQKSMLALKAGFKTLGPMIAAAFGPIVILVETVKAFVQADKAAGDMAKSMNMTYDQARATRAELTDMAERQFDLLNASEGNAVTTKGLQETLMAVNASLGTGVMLSEDMLVQFTQMREMAGFTNEELMGIASLSLATGQEMEDITGEFMAQAQMSAIQNGVLLNEKELLKGIKDVSAATTLSFSKNPKLIAEAVATAKSLGMELSKVEGIADSMLDFESSIRNELEAELLLNKDINLERARQAALNNDLATVAKEISEQVGTSAEFAEMNRIQQEALAKSVGMNREDLAQTLFVQEQLAGATAEEAKEREALLNSRIAAVGLEQAQKELAEGGLEGLKEQQSVAERFGNTIEKLKEVFVSIAEPILAVADALIPFVEMIGAVVTGIMSFSTSVGEFLGKAKDMGSAMMVIAGIGAVLAAVLAYQALAWIPVVGPVLGIAAGAAIIGGYFKAISDTGAKKTGDMFGMADGKTQVSTAEGGLFELSDNDQFAASPSLGAMLGTATNPPQQQTVVQNDNKDVVSAIDKMADKLKTVSMFEVQ